MALKPLGDRVIVRADAAIEKKGLLFIPHGAREKQQVGEIVSVGPGRTESGILVPMSLRVGDKVLFGKYSGTEMEVDGESVLILRESDVMAVVE